MSDNKYQIFLSFKAIDENGNRTKVFHIAEQIYDSLEIRGYKVFYAPSVLNGMVGQEIAPTIEHALESSKLQILVFSNADEVNSEWIKYEWKYFLRNKKTILPVLVDSDYPDYNSIPFEIRNLQYCQIIDDFSYEKLIKTVEFLMSDK